MSENICPLHEGFENQLKKAEENIDELFDKVNDIEKSRALDEQKFTMILETVSESLGKLTSAITSLEKTNSKIEKTMTSMQYEIKQSGEKTGKLEQKLDDFNEEFKGKIEDLDKKICQIDEEGKFNIRTFIKEHIVGVIVGVVGLTAFGTYIFSNFLQSL